MVYQYLKSLALVTFPKVKKNDPTDDDNGGAYRFSLERMTCVMMMKTVIFIYSKIKEKLI